VRSGTAGGQLHDLERACTDAALGRAGKWPSIRVSLI
jgi:hypothetical protein